MDPDSSPALVARVALVHRIFVCLSAAPADARSLCDTEVVADLWYRGSEFQSNFFMFF